jgi:hypothetical protein
MQSQAKVIAEACGACEACEACGACTTVRIPKFTCLRSAESARLDFEYIVQILLLIDCYMGCIVGDLLHKRTG